MTIGRSARSVLVATLAGFGIVVGAAAYAGDCNTDIAGLSQKRQSYIEKLNAISKATKGKLDPVKSCPQLRGLVVAEGALVKYLESNKNWCNVPDEAVNNIKAAAAKSQTFATQACNLAEQAKKMQQQQASGAGLGLETQKLPAGPL